MVKVPDFRCEIEISDVDLSDANACRARMIDIVNGDDFVAALTDLQVVSNSTGTGPAPRGGEITASCTAGDRGTSCSVGASIRW